MKHIIFDLNGAKIGSYEGPRDESSVNRSYLLCPPHAIHVELPEGADEDCISLVLVPEVTAEQANPEMWSNGQISVYNANDIPVLLNENNEPYLDPSFEYIAANPQKEAFYKIIENPRLVAAKNQKKADQFLEEIRALRDVLLKDADVSIFKLEDEGKDSSAMRKYRSDLRNCTEQLKKEDGSAKISCANMVVNEFEFPVKP